MQCADDTDGEKKLPRQRIEEPEPLLWIVWRRNLIEAGPQPDDARNRQRWQRPAPAKEQKRWRREKQHCVKWQNVVIADLVTERGNAEQHLRRAFDQGANVDLRQEVRTPGEQCGRAEDGDRGHGGDDMGSVEHAGAAPHPERRQQSVSRLELATISKGDGNARNQHERFGCIGEAEILVCEELEPGAGHMIDEDHQQSERTQNIDAGITFGRERCGHD